MQVLEGNVQECRYERNDAALECFYDATYHGELVYLGYRHFFFCENPIG